VRRSAEGYAVTVSNTFEALGTLEEERHSDELWKAIKDILPDVAVETVGFQK